MIIKGTSSYDNAKSGNLLSITGDGGNAWGYYGNSYKALAPKLYLWKYYDENPDHLSESDLIDYYIKEYYKVRLKELNMLKLLYTLEEKYGEELILLCHESPSTKLNKEHFCHRRLLADYIELETGLVIPEVYIDKDGNQKVIETYDLKPKIKKLIKK